MQDWLREHSNLLSWLAVGSAAMVAALTVFVPVCIVRMPHDYFVCGSKRQQKPRGPLARKLLKIGRNVLAVVLILAGLSMLLLPGPGIITLGLGLLLLEFPGHHRFRRWLLGRKRVLNTMNWLRRRAHCPPLAMPVDAEGPPASRPRRAA